MQIFILFAKLKSLKHHLKKGEIELTLMRVKSNKISKFGTQKKKI